MIDSELKIIELDLSKCNKLTTDGIVYLLTNTKMILIVKLSIADLPNLDDLFMELVMKSYLIQ